MTTHATTYDELPVFIPAEGNQIFGILTRPTAEPNGVCVVLMLGGVFSLSITRNRLSVKLARRLAAQGYHVFRMDFHGVGESTGAFEESKLGQPWVQDLRAAMGWLREQGQNRFVLLGHCFGGRTCLALTPEIPELLGLGLMVVPVMDYNHFELAVKNRSELPAGQFVKRAARKTVLRGIFIPRHRRRYMHIIRAKLKRRRSEAAAELPWAQASPNYMKYLSGLVDRRVPVLMAFGTECLASDFERALQGKLGKLMKRGEATIQLHRYGRMAHGFPNLDSQEQTMDLIERWLGRVVVPVSPTLAAAEPTTP